MEFILKKFAKEDEYFVQYHVPEKEHISYHPYCLHWWRPQNQILPIPEPTMVGPKNNV